MDNHELVEKQLRAQNEALEGKLCETQKVNQLKNELVVRFSHDFRNSLAAIQGFSELIYHGEFGALSARQHECLGNIISSSKQALQLVDILRSLANKNSSEELTDIDKLMDAIKA